jgi:hypothetical protein
MGGFYLALAHMAKRISSGMRGCMSFHEMNLVSRGAALLSAVGPP